MKAKQVATANNSRESAAAKALEIVEASLRWAVAFPDFRQLLIFIRVGNWVGRDFSSALAAGVNDRLPGCNRVCVKPEVVGPWRTYAVTWSNKDVGRFLAAVFGALGAFGLQPVAQVYVVDGVGGALRRVASAAADNRN